MPAAPAVRRPRRPPAAAPPGPPGSSERPRRRLRMSRAEYEVFAEAQTDAKFEWADGEAIEMAGRTVEHSDLKVRLLVLLYAAVTGGGGKVNDSDLRVRTRGGAGPNRYPDISVSLKPQRFVRHPRDRKLDLLNPTILFEVPSDSTAEEDESGAKSEDYAATPSVTDYVLVDSRAVRVVHRTRTSAGEEWAETTLTDPAAVLELPAVGFAATLAEIYAGVPVG